MLPNPAREILAGWVLQAFDLIEAVMIDLLFDKREGGFDLCKIEHPAEMRVNWSFYVNLNLKAVTVHAAALVAWWYIRQPVRRLDTELLENLHVPTFIECQLLYDSEH